MAPLQLAVEEAACDAQEGGGRFVAFIINIHLIIVRALAVAQVARYVICCRLGWPKAVARDRPASPTPLREGPACRKLTRGR